MLTASMPLPNNLSTAKVLLTAGLLLMPAIALAETHIVTVGDDFFSPNDLTIQAGDTVRWENAAGGNPHDVTADDFSFASPLGASFTYELVFDDAGEVLYHCTVHSAPGLDINSNMNGRIMVEAGGMFSINAGLNDSWFNPATLGQGFFITVFPDIQMMFLAWFTYDTTRPGAGVQAILGEPGHRWLTAFGPYSGDIATLEVELTQGGIFNSAEPMVVQSADGTIDVLFSGCNAGMISYDITSAGVSGQIPIERIAVDNVPVCEGLLGN